jgi:hypothetical protein
MKPVKAMTSLSLCAVLLMGVTGCSDFISLKENSPSPSATLEPYGDTASPAPATPDTDRVDSIPEKTENTTRLLANDTMDRIVDIIRSPDYKKLSDDAAGITPVSDVNYEESMRQVIKNNQKTVDKINTVFTVTDAGLVRMGAAKQSAMQDEKALKRNILVLNRFHIIAEQVEGHNGYIDVTPGAIVVKDGEYYFKNDSTPPKAIAVLKGDGPNDYISIEGFEGMKLLYGGIGFAIDGEVCSQQLPCD